MKKDSSGFKDRYREKHGAAKRIRTFTGLSPTTTSTYGAYWVPTSRTGIAPCHNVGYELVKSFDGVVVTNIPITVNPIIGCITPSQYLAARNLQKVEAEFALQRYVHDVA